MLFGETGAHVRHTRNDCAMTTMPFTDTEFALLVCAAPAALAARSRAETIARNLKDRIAAVAAELRNSVQSGEIAEPAHVALIANHFDRIANADDDAHADKLRSFGAAACERLALARNIFEVDA